MFIDKHHKPIFVHVDEYEADVKEASWWNFRMGVALGGFIMFIFWMLYELQT